MEKKSSNKEEKVRKTKVWLRGDGILCINVSGIATKEDINEMVEKTKDFLKTLQGKGRILLKLTTDLRIVSKAWYTYKHRKILAEKTKNLFKEPGFKKAAIFCKGVTNRTVASFIITASGVDNVKIFDTEEKAVKWLKKP